MALICVHRCCRRPAGREYLISLADVSHNDAIKGRNRPFFLHFSRSFPTAYQAAFCFTDGYQCSEDPPAACYKCFGFCSSFPSVMGSKRALHDMLIDKTCCFAFDLNRTSVVPVADRSLAKKGSRGSHRYQTTLQGLFPRNHDFRNSGS